MRLLELPHTPIEMIQRLLQPILAVETANGQPGQAHANGWRVVSAQLKEWQQAPALLEDDGVEPPSLVVLARAEAIAGALCAAGVEPPDTVVPNGECGVVLRWRAGRRAWWIELDGDGSLEAYLMHDGKLVWRHALHDDPRESE